MNASKTALTLTLTTLLGSAGTAFAGGNPFGMQVLEHGYQVAEAPMSDGKMPDGKCGAKKAEEGKCAANKAEEGKCAANKTATTKAKDGKCGEGKCGAGKKDMPAESSHQ